MGDILDDLKYADRWYFKISLDEEIDLYRRAIAEIERLRAQNVGANGGAGSALADVAAERRRQVEAEGWSAEHDDAHYSGQLAIAAGWYALNAPFIGRRECIGNPADSRHEAHHLFAGKYTAMRWPWAVGWWKPTDPRRDLVKAGALILAEIERLDRAAAEGERA